MRFVHKTTRTVALALLLACSRENELLETGTLPPELQAPVALPQPVTDDGDEALWAHLARRRREPLTNGPHVAFDMAATGSPTSLPAAPTATATRDALVWRSRGSEQHTWWLRCQTGEPCQKLAERNGLWLAGAGEIYGWLVERRMVRVCDMADCAEPDGVCNPGSARGGPLAGRLDEVFWLALTTGKATRLGPRLADQVATDLGSPGLHHYTEPLLAAGGGLLVRVVTETMACGAMNGGTAGEVALVRPGASLLSVPWLATDEAARLQTDHDELTQLAESQKLLPFLHLAAVYLDLDDAGHWHAEVEWRAEPTGSQRPDLAQRTRLVPIEIKPDSALNIGMIDLSDPPRLPAQVAVWPSVEAEPSAHLAGWTWLAPSAHITELVRKFKDSADPPASKLRHAQPHKP